MLRALEYLSVPLGRLLLSAIFLMSSLNKLLHWSQTTSQMEREGIIAVPFFLAMAVVLELGGGISVLLGLKARLGALALLAFLVPVTLVMHDFWQYESPQRMEQMIHFSKNLAIMGGLCVLLAHGAGPVSFDQRSLRRREAAKRG